MIQKKGQSSTVGIYQNFIQDMFWDASSEYVTRMADSAPSNIIKLLHQHLPKGTKIILPTGQKYDARAIIVNHNFHAKNNRLPDEIVSASNPSDPHHSMKLKYETDYLLSAQ